MTGTNLDTELVTRGASGNTATAQLFANALDSEAKALVNTYIYENNYTQEE